jgi:DNA repair photolyase
LQQDTPDRTRRGRGAVGNPTGRFERYRHEPLDDGWTDADPRPEPLRTTVTPETCRSIITRNDSPDVPFDLSINPYRGCEHGCIYCFARPSHAYLGLSPGLDFESRIISKPDAPERLAEELRRPGYQCQVLVLGANTDPYQPADRELRITRRLLEVLLAFRHPVSLVTKGALVLRDLDLLVEMARRSLAHVSVSVTTLDRSLARAMEPRAASPERRLEVIAALKESGVPVGVLSSPMIPGLNDSELEAILEAAAGAGAKEAGYILLRLPGELRQLFTEWLEARYPGRAARVLSLIRQTREGELYRGEFGERMRGTGPYATLLRRRFEVACRKLGLGERGAELDVTRFRPPPRTGDQLPLFR